MAGGVLLLVVQLAGSVQTNTQIDLRTQSIVQTAQDFLGSGFKTRFDAEMYFLLTMRGLLVLLRK